MNGRVNAGVDPTEAVLSESALSVHGVSDYVVNVATGCRHGCAFCYVPSTPPVRARTEMIAENVEVDSPRDDWGAYVLYRETLPDRLDAHLDRKRTWRETDLGRGIVGVSFSTDPYMDERAASIATDVVRVLTEHENHVRVQTRNPVRALRDIDVFRDAGDYVTVGTSIPSFDEAVVRALEPRAPSPESRMNALESFADAGVQVYLMASPTYPTMDEDAIRALLERFAAVNPAVVFHEPFNARSARMQATIDAARSLDDPFVAEAFRGLTDDATWIDYAVRHSRIVQTVGDDLDLPIHICPHYQLTRATSGRVREWFEAWRDRQPPEPFAGRPRPDGPPPEPPTVG